MRRIRSVLIVGALALVASALPASARIIGAGYKTSWGKEGVSLEDYWIDSSQCGFLAYKVDLTGTPPARALVLASRMLENPISELEAARVTQFANPDVQWDRAAAIMQSELDTCLIERGYVKFKLTDSQADELARFEKGSLERRRYLHGLASDPAVLTAQRETDS